METPEASWVTMVMDRLHRLEQDNDALRGEVEALRQEDEQDVSSSQIQVWVPHRESTLFDCTVYTDRPGLCSLKDFGMALMAADPSLGEATLSMVPFSEVWGDTAPLKRHTFCITGIVGPTQSQSHIVKLLDSVWGASILPDVMPVRDLFEQGSQSQVSESSYCMCQFVQRTEFFDVWSAMIGQAKKATDFTRVNQEVRTSRPHSWEQVSEDDPSAWRARLTTAMGIDRFELHGASARKVQAVLNHWDDAIE